MHIPFIYECLLKFGNVAEWIYVYRLKLYKVAYHLYLNGAAVDRVQVGYMDYLGHITGRGELKGILPRNVDAKYTPVIAGRSLIAIAKAYINGGNGPFALYVYHSSRQQEFALGIFKVQLGTARSQV